MNFNKAGNYAVTITKAELGKSKFNNDPNVFDVCIHVETEDGYAGIWRGEISQNYGGKRFAGMTKQQITLHYLEKLGWQHGINFGQLPTLVGMKTEVWVKESTSNGNTFYNVAGIGSMVETVETIDPAEAARRLAAMQGGAQGFAQTAPAPVPVPGQIQPNPYQQPTQQGFTQPQMNLQQGVAPGVPPMPTAQSVPQQNADTIPF